MTEVAASGFTSRHAPTPTGLGLIGRRSTHSVPALHSRLPSTITRRGLQVTLGVIWLVDAALQYQPYMFSKAFVTQIIDPTIPSNPGWIAASQTWAAGMMIHHVAVSNALFATIQLLLAAAILWPRTAKLGLAASVGWAVGVWWFGEGLGGVLTGTSAVTGAPGAAILYAFVALIIWPRRDQHGPRPAGASVADTGLLGHYVPRIGWSLMWLGFAELGLQAANRSPSSLHNMVAGMASGEPEWIKSLDRTVAAPLAHHGTEWSIVLAAIYVLVAAGVWTRQTLRPTLGLALLLAAALWVAENFGGILTGSATDINSGPLLALLALTLWPRPLLQPQNTPSPSTPRLTGVGADSNRPNPPASVASHNAGRDDASPKAPRLS